MPQTLLATLALAIAGVFMLGQSETSIHNIEAIVADEFELAATGALLQALEFADSRAFDEATTPSALRTHLNLPMVMTDEEIAQISAHDLLDIRTADLTPVARFGQTAHGEPVVCNVAAPSTTPLCNDLSDLHGSGWQLLNVASVPGVTLPIEVRFEVSYVEASNLDVPVSHRTFHKRVDAWARSRDLLRRLPGHEIRLHRVISYDPEVAAEYLRRSLHGVSTTCVGNLAHLEEIAAAAAAAAQTAQDAAATARARADALQATAVQRAAAAQAAAQAVTAARAMVTQLQAELAQAQTEYDAANWLERILRGLATKVRRLETQLAEAQTAVTAAQTAAASAQTASAQATAAASEADQQARQAQQAADAARLAAQQAAGAVSAFTCT